MYSWESNDEFYRSFSSLSISDPKKRLKRKIVYSNKQYDEYYFPKAKAVKLFFNRNVNRPFWVKHPSEEDNKVFKLIRIFSLKGKNKEYFSVASPIRNSIRTSIVINGVYKVCNKPLEYQYLLKNIQKQRSTDCKEMIMYHATRPENIESICTHNFNWRYSGTSRGSKYGYGVNFSPDPDFAHQFCKSKNPKVLIVSKVLIAHAHTGSKNLDLPQNGFDTTCSPKKSVYTKFEDCEFYPYYIVYYTQTE